MESEEKTQDQVLRDFSRSWLEAQIRWQKTNPRLQEHPPIVFQCYDVFLSDGTNSAFAKLLSDTPRGQFDELPSDLDMESESHGDHWFVTERIVMHRGASKMRAESKQRGEFFLEFSPLSGMRALEKGEIFRQVSTSRTLQMQYIVKGFPQVDQRDILGFSSLHWAAEYGYAPLVSHLIERGEDINGRTLKQETPVLLATNWEHPEALTLLLRSGAMVEMRDEDGYTALMNAVTSNYVEVTKVLLEFGADPHALGENWECSLLHCAIENRVMGYQNGPIEDVGFTRPSPWLTAIKIVEYLLEHGADVQGQNEEGHTALFLAEQAGDLELVELIKRYVK